MKHFKFILLAIVYLLYSATVAHAHYDPTIGQFISRDPSGEVEDLNLYRITGGDPINYVDVNGLAKVALDGTGNITKLGQTILDVAKGDPNAARSLLMAAQVQAETTGIKVPGDGDQDSMRNVMEAIETAVGQAQSDGSREWKMIAAGAGLSGERGFGGYKDAWMTAKLAEYAPQIAANAQTAIQLRAFERAANEKSTIEQNSPSSKLKEIGLETSYLPARFAVGAFNALALPRVTTGQEVVFNGWTSRPGLYEVPTSSRYSEAVLTVVPMLKLEGVAVSGVARIESGGAFEIIDGVRRAKAASMAGRTTVAAEIFDTSGGTLLGKQDVLLESLFSPNKGVIDVSNLTDIERFASIHEAILKGTPLPPIKVTAGSSGVPVSKIQFNYGR